MEYFGLDVHKRYTVFTHVDERGKLLGQERVNNDPESLSELIAKSTEPAKMVLEAGGIWPVFTDALEDQALEVVLGTSFEDARNRFGQDQDRLYRFGHVGAPAQNGFGSTLVSGQSRRSGRGGSLRGSLREIKAPWRS